MASRGGRGGLGNAHFVSASNQAPDYATRGQKGEKLEYRLVVKSIADVGLIGFPSAGKSTLISKISHAKPKTAAYPFTTLSPELGVVEISHDKRFVVADIPGIISDAHKGRGLGLQFLQHIERTTILALIIDSSADVDDRGFLIPIQENHNPPGSGCIKQVDTLSTELDNFEPELLKKRKTLVVFNKCDLPLAKTQAERAEKILKKRGLETIKISSISGNGISSLINKLSHLSTSSPI